MPLIPYKRIKLKRKWPSLQCSNSFTIYYPYTCVQPFLFRNLLQSCVLRSWLQQQAMLVFDVLFSSLPSEVSLKWKKVNPAKNTIWVQVNGNFFNECFTFESSDNGFVFSFVLNFKIFIILWRNYGRNSTKCTINIIFRKGWIKVFGVFVHFLWNFPSAVVPVWGKYCKKLWW